MTKIVWTAMILAGLGAIAIGGYLAYLQKDGWGWFLAVGFLIFASISIGSGKKHTDSDLRKAFDAGRDTKTSWYDYHASIQPTNDDD